MGSDIENPAVAAVSDAVRKLVVDLYCELEHADPQVVEAGFGGGIPFDSILGVEMAAQIEIKLSIPIPEEALMNSSVYKSLAAFAALVQACSDTANEGEE
jgi:acyl carrier protein